MFAPRAGVAEHLADGKHLGELPARQMQQRRKLRMQQPKRCKQWQKQRRCQQQQQASWRQHRRQRL